jgi:hypothetical protein
MRWALAAAIVPFALAAHADTVHPGLTGNDSGGSSNGRPISNTFIATSPSTIVRADNKIAVISSVHHRYGEYVGFRCYFPREYDPRKAFLYGPY